MKYTVTQFARESVSYNYINKLIFGGYGNRFFCNINQGIYLSTNFYVLFFTSISITDIFFQNALFSCLVNADHLTNR